VTGRGVAARPLLLGAARFVIALAVYAGAAALWWSASGGPDRMPGWVAVLATGVVAVAFGMLRRPLDALADRMLLGGRSTGYATVRALLARMATTLPVDEVIPALAETAGRTVHADRAEVRVLLSDGADLSRVWAAPAVPPARTADTVTVGVRHHGTAVGEIEVEVTDQAQADHDRRLLRDLAGPAGVAVSTVRLTVELRRRAADLELLAGELAESNRRIGDARRSQLAAVHAEMTERVLPLVDRARAGLDSASGAGARGAPDVTPDVTGTADAVAGALDALRTLARGVYPPRLTEAGLAVSIEGWQHRTGRVLRLRIVGDQAVLRRDEDLESLVYFGVVGMVDGLRAGGAEPPAVTLDVERAQVRLTVAGESDGPALDRAVDALRDRVEAFGGALERTSIPAGEDSRVRIVARLPYGEGSDDMAARHRGAEATG
jgi:hypothetical protein